MRPYALKSGRPEKRQDDRFKNLLAYAEQVFCTADQKRSVNGNRRCDDLFIHPVCRKHREAAANAAHKDDAPLACTVKLVTGKNRR